MRPREGGYHERMTISARSLALGLTLVGGLAFSLAGCDAGGLLKVQASSTTGGPEPVVLGPSSNDLVSGGTVAQSSKYKVVYTMGQSSPSQGVSKSKGHRDNGGLVGAMSDE